MSTWVEQGLVPGQQKLNWNFYDTPVTSPTRRSLPKISQEELDKDGDGKISIKEFADGFRDISETLLTLSRQKRKHRLSIGGAGSSQESDDEGATCRKVREDPDGQRGAPPETEFIFSLDEGFKGLSCQEQVCDLYQNLHAADLPQLLTQFENIILSVIKDIRHHQYENERLERSYKREKDAHVRHMRQMEEEMETQVQRVENRVRKEEKAKTESEKEELKKALEAEISELQTNLKKLQKLDHVLMKTPEDDLKNKFEETSGENRQLKSSLTDAQTNLAILRSELATLRQQVEEKTEEVDKERETLVEYIREQDNLTRQVHLLHDANKTLHDTNDDLRAALENARSTGKRPYLGASYDEATSTTYFVLARPMRRARRENDLAQEYISSRSMSTPAKSYYRTNSNTSGNSSLADELNSSLGMRGLLPAQESCEDDGIPDDIDSGHSTMSTMRDSHDIDSEYEPNSIEDDSFTPRKRNRMGEFDSTTESELENADSNDEMDDDQDTVDGNLDMELEETIEVPLQTLQPGRPLSRSNSACSTTSRGSSRGSIKMNRQTSGSVRRKLPSVPVQKPITGEPERMYKVVLAGDAAVGKSSFIMRLCKNKFVNNLNSTLGVDFQTKILEVDGRVIALQLWDTAGQERFRSIAKSYFRRADGVLLLYDCSYERSFINVRDWVEAVEDGAQKKIPIMLCGNKADLRDDAPDGEEKRFVKKEDGNRLAKQFEALFIETSAKEGSNVIEAVTELARMLRTNEDIEVKSVGMKLQDMKGESAKKKACCNV